METTRSNIHKEVIRTLRSLNIPFLCNGVLVGNCDACDSSGATDLVFSGGASPYTLNSSTGTDVTFTEGTGVTLSATPGNLTITNSSPASAITASNGLTRTGDDIKLGGTLTANTFVVPGANYLIIDSTSGGLAVNNLSGIALGASNDNGVALSASTLVGIPGFFQTNPASTNTVLPILQLNRHTQGTASAGIGGSIDYYLEDNANNSILASSISTSLTNVSTGVTVGALTIGLVNSGTVANKLTLAGSGAFRLHNYGTGTFTGTATRILQVDASGNVIEGALTGSGLPAGSDREIQFNNAGAFGAAAGFVWTATSRLGLAQAAPQERLDVSGNIRTSIASGGTIAAFEADGTRANRIIMGADASGGFFTGTFASGGSGDIRFINISTEAMRIKSGQVGIGTIAPASKLDITTAALGVAQTDTSGLALINTTAAAAGAQQISPAIRWRGFGWKTTATAASQSVDFRADVLPIEGTTAPTGRWQLSSSINGGAYTNRFSVASNTLANTSIESFGLALGSAIIRADAGVLQAYWGSVNNGFINWAVAGITKSYGANKTDTSGTVTLETSDPGFAPTSGTAVHNTLRLAPVINQTGGANGITRALYINPTLTAAADFKAIDITGGQILSSTAGIASFSAMRLSGTWFTGGTATTTKPLVNIEPTGATSTNWSTSGTGLGINAASGFTGNLIDLQLNGAGRFKVTSTGNTIVAGDVDLTTVGGKIKIATGANASVGTATLVAGTVTVSTTAVTTNSIIFVSIETPGATVGSHSAPSASIVNGTSFVINSTNGADTSSINWWIVN